MSTLKEKIRSGEKIFGVMIKLVRNPALPHLIRAGGLDFAMYDCEHSNFSMETLHDLFMVHNAVGTGAFVRVPSLSRDYVSRVLDQGARGVMVPMCETKEMAAELVRFSKYDPIGMRGFASATGQTAYHSELTHRELMDQINSQTFAIAQIETKLSVDNADQIAATPGLDALLVGPNDLSISLGVPGDLLNPLELEAIGHVSSACKKNGKAFGLHASHLLLSKFYDSLDIVMMQSDVDFLINGFASIKKSFM